MDTSSQTVYVYAKASEERKAHLMLYAKIHLRTEPPSGGSVIQGGGRQGGAGSRRLRYEEHISTSCYVDCEFNIQRMRHVVLL